MAPDAMADPVRANLPAIKQMLAAKLYPSGFPVGPLYVNEKQYYRILRRRQVRLRLNSKRKSRGYMHESRHKHAMNRPRGPGGRFLSSSNNKSTASSQPADAKVDEDNQQFDRLSGSAEHKQQQHDIINTLEDIQIDHIQQQGQIPNLDPPQIRQSIQPPLPQDSAVFQIPMDINSVSYCINPASSATLQQSAAPPPIPSAQDPAAPISIQHISQGLIPPLSVSDHPLQLRKGV